MRTGHLFAGIGGGILSDLILGHTPIFAVEWDKYACKILRERVSDGWFPEMRVYEGDVRMFDPSEYAGRVDCIHAGFPCQDISVAGKQAGLGEGTRSGLYREVLRIAGIIRPRYLFLENVSAILSMGGTTVIADLAKMGYVGRALCIRASDVGAPHGRDRWFALAERRDFSPHPEHNGDGRGEQQQAGVESTATMADTISERAGRDSREIDTDRGGRSWGNESPLRQTHGQDGSDRVIAASEIAPDMGNPEHNGQLAEPQLRSNETTSNQRWQEEPQQAGQPTGADRPADVPSIRRGEDGGESAEEVAYTSSQRQQGQGAHEQSFDYSQTSDRKADRSFNDGEAGQGNGQFERGLGLLADEFSPQLVSGWWEQEPDVGRVTNVSKDRVAQLKGLGNAQVPLQAAAAFRLLMGG